MIIVKIQGGLGNQLFQYALGRHIALLRNTELKLDLSFFENDFGDNTPREYSLSHFNIVASIAVKKDIKEIKVPNTFSTNIFKRIIRKVFRYLEEKKPISKKKYVRENREFTKEIFNVSNNVYLYGNWQSYKYFENIKPTIIQELSLINPISIEAGKVSNEINKTNSISVHIRRGDYVSNNHTNSFHGTCSPEYYKDAVNEIIKTIKNPTLFVFSDDINWVKENIKFQFPAIYVSKPEIEDYEELILMSKCKHNIIANSSFSWWGAWLNSNPNKIVVAPTPWFNGRKQPRDLIPQSWIEIGRNY